MLTESCGRFPTTRFKVGAVFNQFLTEDDFDPIHSLQMWLQNLLATGIDSSEVLYLLLNSFLWKTSAYTLHQCFTNSRPWHLPKVKRTFKFPVFLTTCLPSLQSDSHTCINHNPFLLFNIRCLSWTQRIYSNNFLRQVISWNLHLELHLRQQLEYRSLNSVGC